MARHVQYNSTLQSGVKFLQLSIFQKSLNFIFSVALIFLVLFSDLFLFFLFSDENLMKDDVLTKLKGILCSLKFDFSLYISVVSINNRYNELLLKYLI